MSFISTGDTVLVDSRDRAARLERAIARHGQSASALIEVLHSAQKIYGHLSPDLLKAIAHRLKLPPSRVLGVATFYHLFRLHPPAPHTVTICVGTACYAAGSAGLVKSVQKRASGEWGIETGRCVGSCGLAPVAICDGHPIARATSQELQERFELASDHVKNPA